MAGYILKKEDLSRAYWPIIDAIGVEAFLALVNSFGGRDLYIPKSNSVYRDQRNEAIQDEFDGYNFGELAQKYNLTERTIREIVAPVLRKIRSLPMDNQMSMLDCQHTE